MGGVWERTIPRVEEELEKALADEREARARRTTLTRELHQLRIAQAEREPHPWLGKRVKRKVRRGFRGRVFERGGVVTIYDPAKHHALRELYFRDPSRAAGQPFVISDSGLSGWKLELADGELHPLETNWELAE